MEYEYIQNNQYRMEVRKIKKIIISIIILFFIIMIGTSVTAKYITDNVFIIGNIKIDREKPKIEIKSINKQKEGFLIIFRVEVKERNIISNNLNKENLLIKINNSVSSPKNIDIKEILKEDDGIIYDIAIECSEVVSNLSLIIKDSIIMDVANQGNDEVEFVYSREK